MRHFACLPLFAALLAVPTACDAKKPEPPPQQQAPAPIAQIEGKLDFSEISVGESAAKSLTIKNAGNAPLEVSAISYPESLSGPNKPATVSPGGTLAIEVKFSPTKAGAAQGAVAISTNGGKLEVPVTGSAKEVMGVLELAKQTPFEKVTVGEKATGTLILRNTGNAPLTIAGLTMPEGFAANFSGTIPPANEQKVPLVFSPLEPKTYSGLASVNLTTGQGTTSLEISGTASAPPPAPRGMTTVNSGKLPATSALASTEVQTFHIGTHEVTWGEWSAVSEFAANNNFDLPAAPKNAKSTHPVRGVSWNDAVKWLNARSQMEGLLPVYSVNGEIYRSGNATPEANLSANGYRLPTEAEWEWAARGGSKSLGTSFSGGNDLNEVAVNWDNAIGTGEDLLDGRGPAAVGTKKENELGLHDMSGNIAEWCWNEVDGGARRVRGGAWLGAVTDCEVARQSFAGPTEKRDDIGFRYARNLIDPAQVAVQPNLAFTTAEALPDATANTDYSAKIEIQGGAAPYSLTLEPGSTLPPGLVFSNGTLSGTPKAAGSFALAILATDSTAPVKNTAAKEFTLRVKPYGLSIDPEPTAIQAQYNEPLSVTFAPEGGAEPFRWSVAGPLPRGLKLDSKLGELSGKPLVPGISSIAIRLTDSKGFETVRVVPLTVSIAPVQIGPDPEKAPTANVNTDFSWSFALKGGVPPYSVKVSDGSTLPKGLAISTSGSTARLVGIPGEAGNYKFSLEASDSFKATTSLPVELTVAPYSLAISEPTPEQLSGKYLEDYSITLNATGGRPPYYWAVVGKVPPGLSVKALSGVLSGKPTAAGKFPVTIKVSDVNDIIVSRDATIEITTSPLNLAPNPAEAPAGTAGLSYEWKIAFSGGVPPYTLKPAPDTTLPEGLSASVSASTGKISGKPTAPGTYPLALEATDSLGEKASLQAQVTVRPYDLAIAPETTQKLVGKFKQALDISLNAAGGKPPYKWSITGPLPNGTWLSSSTGKLAGTPYTTGDFPITLKVTDANNISATTDGKLVITADPLQIVADATEPQQATSGLAYRRTFAIQGGVPPYSLKLKEGNTLPPGMELEFTGTKGSINGKPAEAGKFSCLLVAIDSRKESTETNIDLAVSAYDLQVSETLAAPITAKYDQTLAVTLAANGGKPPYVWKIEGKLPIGIRFSSQMGSLIGKPQTPGEFPITLKVTDANRVSATRNGSIVVTAEELKIETTTLPPGKKGVPYSQQIKTSGGIPPVTLGIEPGSPLAPGLTLGEAGILGTPKSGGQFSVRIVAMDSKMTSAVKDFTLVIEDPTPTPTPTPEPSPASTPEPTPQATPEPTPTPQPEPTSTPKSETPTPTTNAILVKGGQLPVTSPLGKQAVGEFVIDRTEVTLGEWKKIQSQAEARGYDIGKAGSAPGDNHPVTNVSWFDAVKWCNLRSELEGLQPAYVINGAAYKSGETAPTLVPGANGYRLPTEVEWEWAARGGASSKSNSYSGANEPDTVAWYASNSGNGNSKPVAGKSPNELGVYDMSGNAREWVWDAHKTYRRVRGGGAGDQSFDCSVSVSDFNYPNSRTPDTGFRAVRSPSN